MTPGAEPPATERAADAGPGAPARGGGLGGGRRRVLAVVSRFKWSHLDYLHALGERFDLAVAWAGEAHAGAVARAVREGIRATPIGRIEQVGAAEVAARLRGLLESWRPGVVHVMYYHHEALTPLVRTLVGDRALVVHECRDPLTTLTGAAAGSPGWRAEGDALRASDAQILVSAALRAYLERTHGLDLAPTSLIVPHGFSRRNVGPPAPKLSARDGRAHVAIVGTADPLPDHGRYYVDLVRRFVSLGLVVHSHFHDLAGVSLAPYRDLAAALPDYHHHPTVSFRQGTLLSETISRYDLMAVCHELGARWHNESATLAVCMPTKAVCGWLLGGIPVVCLPSYGGLVDIVRELGMGFVVARWEDIAEIAADRSAVARATAACLAHRHRFTHERSAERVDEFVERRLAARA